MNNAAHREDSITQQEYAEHLEATLMLTPRKAKREAKDFAKACTNGGLMMSWAGARKWTEHLKNRFKIPS